jgi:transposase InsO family protein
MSWSDNPKLKLQERPAVGAGPLNEHWFRTLAEARTIVEAWRDDYITVRPHRSPAGRTPNDYARALLTAGD